MLNSPKSRKTFQVSFHLFTMWIKRIIVLYGCKGTYNENLFFVEILWKLFFKRFADICRKFPEKNSKKLTLFNNFLFVK